MDEILAETIGDIEQLTSKVVEAANFCREEGDPVSSGRHSNEIKVLFEARRLASEPTQRKDLTRKIGALLRKKRQERNSRKLYMVLESDRSKTDLQRILNGPVEKKLSTAVRDSSGTVQTSRDSILEALADFNAKLYAAMPAELELPSGNTESLPISREEVRATLRKLRVGKAAGDDSLSAEMLKTNHQGLIHAIANLFSDILAGNSQVPEVWCVFRNWSCFTRKETQRCQRIIGQLL